MSRAPTRRKCRHCHRFFLPDPRAADRQRYCSDPECQQASKLASQRRWLSKNGNGDYFRGPRAVERVQAWRKLHPGYWRRQTLSSWKVKLLIINRLTLITPLVTYREDCPVRYKRRA